MLMRKTKEKSFIITLSKKSMLFKVDQQIDNFLDCMSVLVVFWVLNDCSWMNFS